MPKEHGGPQRSAQLGPAELRKRSNRFFFFFANGDPAAVALRAVSTLDRTLEAELKLYR